MLTFRLILYGITTLLTLAFLLIIIPRRTNIVNTCFAVVITVIPILMFHHYRFLIFSPLPQELQLISMLVEAVLFMVLFLVIGKYRDFRTVFLVVVLISLMSGGKIAAAIIFIYGVQSLGSFLFLILADLLVFLILIKRVDPIVKALMKESDRGWASLSVIPTFFYITTYLIAYYPDTIYEKPVSLFVILALFATQIATYTQFFAYMKIRVDRAYEQKALIAARSYNEGLEVQREQVEKTKNELRILRHDIRSSTGALYSLLELNEIEDVKIQLKKYIDKTQSGSLEIYCENPYINSVVSESLAKLKEEYIKVKLTISLKKDLGSKEEGMAILLKEFFNFAYYLITNNRCEKGLRLTVKHHNEKIFIEGIIPINETLVKSEFKSKSPEELIGEAQIGSFEMIVKKIGGILDMDLEQNNIIVRILI